MMTRWLYPKFCSILIIRYVYGVTFREERIDKQLIILSMN